MEKRYCAEKGNECYVCGRILKTVPPRVCLAARKDRTVARLDVCGLCGNLMRKEGVTVGGALEWADKRKAELNPA